VKAKPSVIDTQLDLVGEEVWANFSGKKLSSVQNERWRGAGPPYIRVGRVIKYWMPALRAHVAAKIIDPASKPTLINQKPRRARL